MGRKKESSNSYYSVSTEGKKIAGRKGIKAVPAPYFPLGAIFDGPDDDRRIFGKDPEHQYLEINQAPDPESRDGFQIVGAEYFESQPEESTGELVSLPVEFVDELEVDYLHEVEVIILEGSAHFITLDRTALLEPVEREGSLEIADCIEDCLVEPEDYFFSLNPRSKRIPNYKEPEEVFWRKELINKKRRSARKYKHFLNRVAANVFFRDIVVHNSQLAF